MPIHRRRFLSLPIALFAAIGLTAGCASQRQPEVDPIFTAVPGSQYECYETANNGRGLAGVATSSPSQAIAGAAVGGLVGNQFGSGSGRDLATGAGVALGAAGGVWNANRMQNNRVQDCLNGQRLRAPAGANGY